MTGTAVTEGANWEIYDWNVVRNSNQQTIARDDREDKIYKTNVKEYNAVIG
jgi:preprotein translocase subunit SecA